VIAFKMLEPYAGKLARTVLRGRKLPSPLSVKNNITDDLLKKMRSIAYEQIAHLQYLQVDTQPKIAKKLFLFLYKLKMTIFID